MILFRKPSNPPPPRGNADPENVAQGFTFMSKNSYELKTGTSTYTDTSDATATASDIVDGKTAYVNGQKVTGNLSPTTFSPSKNSIQTNAEALNQSGDSYVLLFNATVPDVNSNLLGLSITFMTDGDASWEYETGKDFDVTAMSYSVMVINGELVANQQTIDLGSASMTANINNADISSGVVTFDIVFTPSAGTFTINNSQPMISVDVWSY